MGIGQTYEQETLSACYSQIGYLGEYIKNCYSPEFLYTLSILTFFIGWFLGVKIERLLNSKNNMNNKKR